MKRAADIRNDQGVVIGCVIFRPGHAKLLAVSIDREGRHTGTKEFATEAGAYEWIKRKEQT